MSACALLFNSFYFRTGSDPNSGLFILAADFLDSGFRSILLSLAISGIMPIIDAYGVMITNIASAVLVWLGFG